MLPTGLVPAWLRRNSSSPLPLSATRQTPASPCRFEAARPAWLARRQARCSETDATALWRTVGSPCAPQPQREGRAAPALCGGASAVRWCQRGCSGSSPLLPPAALHLLLRLQRLSACSCCSAADTPACSHSSGRSPRCHCLTRNPARHSHVFIPLSHEARPTPTRPSCQHTHQRHQCVGPAPSLSARPSLCLS